MTTRENPYAVVDSEEASSFWCNPALPDVVWYVLVISSVLACLGISVLAVPSAGKNASSDFSGASNRATETGSP